VRRLPPDDYSVGGCFKDKYGSPASPEEFSITMSYVADACSCSCLQLVVILT